MASPGFPRDREREERNPRAADENRINEHIRVPRVRLIDADGEMLGVMTAREALLKAQDAGLDLVEISPNADPPVCKILDYGKFRYQEQKRKNEARKKQKVIEIKELKLRPTIEQHDLDVKLKAAMRFLEEGDKVKFTLRFRGREMAHKELGMKILDRVKEALADKIKIDQEPKFEGTLVIMVVSAAAAK
jgi:translation initiation factor IF-3